MQLKQIARDALLKPLSAVSGIVERRHTLPILANVLLEQKEGSLYVTATDLEMQITAHSALPPLNYTRKCSFAASVSGTNTTMRVPRPSAESMRTAPLIISARSRMFTMPRLPRRS